jgi:putative oxidoreductase
MSTSTDLQRESATIAASDSWILLFARLTVVPLFIYSGVGKVLAFNVTAGRLNGWADGFGSALAAGAIAVELVGGAALLLGLFARQAAVALILFTIGATLMFHNFWAAPEAQVVQQTVNFLKNIGLIGALALIAFHGPGRYAVHR